MPVIVNSENPHPFLPSLGSISAIEKNNAQIQDIRPLEIAIVNLMADKQTTERQLAYWLGKTPLQVNLTFAATDSYIHEVRQGRETKNTPVEHIQKFYNAWSSIKGNKYDGLIVTGVNALKPRVQDEALWPEVVEILEWSKTNVLSSLFLCWGAKAALKHFHDLDSVPLKDKLWGVFPHEKGQDSTEILAGFSDVFDLPTSRWKTPRCYEVEQCKSLEIPAISKEVGANIIVEPAALDESIPYFPRRVYILAHPEYDTNTLLEEYQRDSRGERYERIPAHYFPNNDPTQKPINTWRSSGFVYTNWVHLVYNATPYKLEDIPSPSRNRVPFSKVSVSFQNAL